MASGYSSPSSMELACPANSSNEATSNLAPSPCDQHKNNGAFAWHQPRSLEMSPAKSKGESTDDEYEEVDLISSYLDESDSLQETNLIESKYKYASSLSSSTPSSSLKDSHGRFLSHQGLSSKYQPKVFDDIVGHDMIIKALSNAISWKRISPLYLFHGPGGTGKTSVARIFAMALNCESSADLHMKPCWACTSCSRSQYETELCSFRNKRSICETIHNFLQSTVHAQPPTTSSIKVFIIDNKHCSSAAESLCWDDLLNLAQEFEDQMSCSVVFILISDDASSVPRTVSSRCQKFHFSKLSDVDVLLKLSRIVAQEGIQIRKNALKLIARKAEGNLRAAENLLDQLALLNLKIDSLVIQQLVGLVPYSKLVRLLHSTLSANATESVKHARDLIGSGIEPQLLLSQLSSLVMELLADSCSSPKASKDQRSIESHSPLRNMDPERLCHALTILIETEKQLKTIPCNQATWVTAAVVQIASASLSNKISTGIEQPDDEKYGTTERLDSVDTRKIEDPENSGSSKMRKDQFSHSIAQHLSNSISTPDTKGINMDELWHNILETVQNKSLRDFLQHQATLLSLTVSRANAIVHLLLKHSEKTPDESIENTLKAALGCPVTLNISREPVHQDSAEGNFTQISRLTKQTILIKPSVSQEFVPDVTSNVRSTKFQNTLQTFGGRTGNGVSTDQSGQNTLLSNHLALGGQDGTSEDPKVQTFRRDQSFDCMSLGKAEELKLSPHSLSSLVKIDASIEPYSQDLLFEEAKLGRKQREKYSKLYKDILRPNQNRHNIYYINRGLDRAQSYVGIRRGENMVNEDLMRLATKSRSLKWTFPCRESTIISSITDARQSDLRKSVPPTTEYPWL